MKIVKYFFEFISIISLFCIFKIIGLKNASNLGSLLGKFIGPLFRSKDIIKSNIKLGLGNIDEKKEKVIINGMWSNIGRTFAEYVFLKDFKHNRTNFEHMKINGVKAMIIVSFLIIILYILGLFLPIIKNTKNTKNYLPENKTFYKI